MRTYVVAPPDGGIVRARDSSTVAWARSVGARSIKSPEVLHTTVDVPSVGLGPNLEAVRDRAVGIRLHSMIEAGFVASSIGVGVVGGLVERWEGGEGVVGIGGVQVVTDGCSRSASVIGWDHLCNAQLRGP